MVRLHRPVGLADNRAFDEMKKRRNRKKRKNFVAGNKFWPQAVLNGKCKI
jgi:hypothetical protein